MSEERRLVTILFADVVGSTALGESLDPEDVRALLSRLFAIARDAVEQRGGRVEKFIGDAIMAVFGVPSAHDDDAARALSAALDLRDRVKADPALRERIPIRLGVNGGQVIATGEADAQQFLITGDPVNVAARLQQAAEPWSIVVGERTVRAAGVRFRFGPSMDVEAKGKAAPIQARELLGELEGPAPRPRGLIVGRDADLDQLGLVARRTFDEGRPFLVSIVAPAGVGKSRLLEEFIDHLDPSVRVATAQCLPYGQRLTYWPMRAILLSIVDLPDEATPDEIRTRLGVWLRDAGELDAERTAELLATTIGASEIEGDRLALFAAWRRLVELAAERAPLVLVIEDLHWSSDSLLDLVESMLQPRADVPLLMFALARPELLDRRPGWGGGRRNAISIALEPLPSSAVAALVADLLQDPAQAIVEAVVARAEGNPFYAGEIVRSLVDRLGPAPSPSFVADAIAALPDTVHATVLARLDALEPTARRVVQLGAVLGRTFEAAAIPALDAGLTANDVEAAIEGLVARDLVRPAARRALTFRHILIREVAYGTLPRAERARLHAAAGRWLVHLATSTGREDELAELVAFHLREAASIDSLLGERPSDALATDAVTWLRRAGEVAAAGAAIPEAARHLNAAIELAPRELKPDLYERLGQIWSGGDQGAEAFERAWDLGQELHLGPDQELRTLGQAMIARARWLGSIGHRLPDEEASRRYAQIEWLLGQAASEVALFHGQLAMAFRPSLTTLPDAAELEEADRWASLALTSAQRLGQPDLLSAALDGAGANAIAGDDMTRTIELAEERHRIEDRISTAERADAWIVHAWAEAIRGNLDKAERAADHARAGLVTGQAASFVLGATAWRVVALHALGRWEEALVDAVKAERAMQESELAAPLYSFNGFLAALAISRGRADTVGADHWRDVLSRLIDQSDPQARIRGLAGYLTDDLDALAQAAINGFRVFSGRLDYVHIAAALLADRRKDVDVDAITTLLHYAEARGLLLVSAQAKRLRGIAARSRDDLEQAADAFSRMGARPFVARSRAELGLLTDQGDLIDRAIDDLEALGDVEQAARVAGERRTGALSLPG
jgi:class 3 adenylate cyclase